MNISKTLEQETQSEIISTLEDELEIKEERIEELEEEIDELEDRIDKLNAGKDLQGFVDWASVNKPDVATQELVDAINSYFHGDIKRVILYK